MFETVEIPLWAVWLAGALALVGAIDRIVGPTLRWYFRRRLNRAIAELNERLHVKIQPFKLTRRRVLIDRLVHDPEVARAIEEHAEVTGMPREAAMDEVRTYAREIVPAFSARAYFGVGARLSRWIAESLYRVRVGVVDRAALDRIDPGAAIVFVMNHRSNVDYLLVTYLSSGATTLSYAVGEWARVWPLSRIIRAMGAFFIRRRSRNGLYRKVLARYVRMATDAGVTQAIFPEGGLSRDGCLGEPKLGLLSYLVDGFDPEGAHDVIFVPVALNYDRVLEDRILIAAETTRDGRPRFRVSVGRTIGFMFRLAWLRLTGRLYRFGYACVRFGEPISLRGYLAEEGADVAVLGERLMDRIGEVVPVLPVSLLSRVMLEGEGPFSQSELRALVGRELARLRETGAELHLPRQSVDYAVEVGRRMLLLRRAVVSGPDGDRVEDEALLRYYANAISHL